MPPIELIQQFWTWYEKIKAGDMPNTLAEAAQLLRLTADVLEWLDGAQIASVVSQEEAEAVVKAWAAGDATVAADVRRPGLRKLFEVMWPVVQPILIDLIRKGIGA